jgi:hypothetical protein
MLCSGDLPFRPDDARPPDLTVIVVNAPRDITLHLTSGGKTNEGYKRQFYGTTYFVFYDFGVYGVTLEVSGGGTSYSQPVSEAYLKGYESVVSLDFSSRAITEGRFVQRTVLLAALNILITLAVEGLLFFIFRFRMRRSWIAFFAVNLATQIFLNCILYGGNLFLKSYYITDLFFVEIFVVILEIICFLVLLREHQKGRRVGYVLAANASSFVLGYYLMSILPL